MKKGDVSIRLVKPILYGTTTEFLRFFNLESLDDLPQPEKEVIDENK